MGEGGKNFEERKSDNSAIGWKRSETGEGVIWRGTNPEFNPNRFNSSSGEKNYETFGTTESRTHQKILFVQKKQRITLWCALFFMLKSLFPK